MKPYKTALFLFRRDLRLEDNLALMAALEQSEEVIPMFIFDPRQCDRARNEYFSEPSFHFLLNSLRSLDAALRAKGSRLYLCEGAPEDIVDTLILQDDVDAVFMGKDYTPFARTRDKAIARTASLHKVAFARHDDLTLAPIEIITTGQGKWYTIFTPFMKNAVTYEVAQPRKNNFSNYFSSALNIANVALSDFAADVSHYSLSLAGGREEALSMLRELDFLKHYSTARNLPATAGTSRLSAHHKYGTISIRETYQAAVAKAGKHHQFVTELYWRDFYYYIAYHFPIVFKQSFLPWAKHLPWENDIDQFAAWCKGRTGVPMVDAGMRELLHTGWMHNRARMIVASYLTKNLLIDWRWGEKFFAQHLIDYDPAQNNGGWQWSASTGADPRPLRIFNPYTQAANYDPNAIYIKKWLPELKDVPSELLTNGKAIDFSEYSPSYPAPLIDQKESYHRALSAYKKAKTAS